MKKKIITGIQQIGIGVVDFNEDWKWYRRHFGMDVKIFEEEAIAEYMLHYTEGKTYLRHAVLAMNMQGGGGFEVWQHTGKTPVKAETPLMLGDLGINICKMKTADIKKTYNQHKTDKLNLLSEIKEAPNGVKHFFVKDPFDNTFQFIEEKHVFYQDGRTNGGTYGAIIGVSDIDKSFVVYQDILDYDEIVYDKKGKFDDLSDISGGNNEFRRVLLRHSKPRIGAFSQLLGPTQIELIQVLDRNPKQIFEGRIWGDPGFIHLCFDINGFDLLRKECELKGFPFTVDITKVKEVFDMGKAAGLFSYISDLDGLPIEFVETKKIPLVKKFGLYIKLYKRNPKKSLPKWMLKLLRFARVK